MEIIKSKSEKLSFILKVALLFLIVAQFDRRFIDSYYALLILPLLFFLMIAGSYFLKSRFVFILLIFIGSHFAFLPEVGGSFTIIAGATLIYYFLAGTKLKETNFRDNLLDLFLIILVVQSILGWISKSNLSARHLVFSIVAFFSLIWMFKLCSGIVWSRNRVRLFVILICLIGIYALFTSIVNTINLLPFKSSLWNSYEVETSGENRFFIAMIQRPASAIGAMYLSFLLPFLLIGKSILVYLKKPLLIAGLISAGLICILSFSKSHSVVLGISFFLIPVTLFYTGLSMRGLFFRYFYIVALLIIIILVSQPFFNFYTLVDRFKEQPQIASSFFENPLLLEETSREESFRLGLESLKRENWIVGYGYSNGDQNRIAWFGKEKSSIIRKLDFHNTYYSLPQIFGWFGAISYLSIFLITIVRLFRLFRDRKIDFLYRTASFSFASLFIIHMMTEYSITALSSPHYMMVLFILLGLANALVYNYRLGYLHDKRT